MNSCDSQADDAFGPQVVACRDGFDFTLLFEQSVLSIVPSTIVLLASIGFLAPLLGQSIKVQSASRWSVRIAKQIPIMGFIAVQVALIILWSSPNNHPTRLSLPSVVLSLAAGLALAGLSWLEHTRSVRPSTIINLYLAFSVLFDVAQCRTLWLRRDNSAVAAVFSTSLGLKVFILAAEIVEKRDILDEPYAQYPPEALSGILNRSVFWWINSLLSRGSSTRLELDDLFSLDMKLTTEYIEPRFRRAWALSSKKSSYSLLVASLRCFWFKVLTIVFFRLCLIGFKFSQPFLIHRAVSLLDEPESQEKRNIGRTLIGATSLIYIGIALTTGTFRHNVYRLITMVRGAIVGLIYHTTLRLDSKTASDSAALTLMSTDIESIASGLEVFDSLWADPIEIAIAIYLLYIQIGLAFLTPIVTSLVFVSVPIALRGVSGSAQKQWLESIERRVAVIASALSNIKGIKMIGLSDIVQDMLQAFRIHELQVAGKFRAMLAVSVTIGSMSHVSVPVITLITYILIMDAENTVPLTSARAFTALSAVSLLAYPIQNIAKAVPQLAAAAGCFQRIQEYILTSNGGSMVDSNQDSKVPAASVDQEQQQSNQPAFTDGFSEKPALLTVRNADFNLDSVQEPLLVNISLTVRPGTWTIITGPVGCGKSLLLLALMNELRLVRGSIDRAALLAAGVGYCAQDAWLPNLSVRDIITSNDVNGVDETWYKTVVDACVLRSDFDELPASDCTVIGSNGVSLSGGQKQRVSLARAIYSRKPLLILDDILSGLDPVTEQEVIERLFGSHGLLRKHSITAILATHSVRHARRADHIIVLGAGGTISEQGHPSEILKNLSKQTECESEESKGSKSFPSAPGFHTEASQRGHHEESTEAPAERLDMARQTGDFRLYGYYFRALGWVNTIGMAVAILAYAVFQRFPTLWVQWWTQAEVEEPGKRTDMYAGVYGAFCGICLACFSLCIFLLFHYGIPHSSIALHSILLKATLDAPYWFFVSTDTGDLINRFSQDMSLVCMQLPVAFIDTMFNAGVCIIGGVLITMATYWSLAICPALIVVLYILQNFYLRTSRQMRLLDLEAKAPLYSYFLETLRGITTIKAFGWQSSAEQQNAKLLDNSQRPFYLMYSIQRWLNLVLDLLVAGVATLIVALATNLDNSSAGALGVSLVNILTFSQDLTYLIRTWTDLETSLGAIARVKSFEAETPCEHFSRERINPPVGWPSTASIEFKDLSASYKAGGECILNNISLRIPGGSKVGICGRTGSGKSTFILTLLRLAEVQNGEVIIDGLSITSLPRTVLRQRVIAVPQDPLLLPGTVRFNVDPFSKHQDEAILAVIADSNLLDIVQSADGGLDASIDSLSLSRGQQQLFCLARALLGESRIVVLDEITSSVDEATEKMMMNLINEKFAGSTILAIAHHLHTVRNFDIIVVLDQGRVVETGSPDELLSKDSVFRELWSQSQR